MSWEQDRGDVNMSGKPDKRDVKKYRTGHVRTKQIHSPQSITHVKPDSDKGRVNEYLGEKISHSGQIDPCLIRPPTKRFVGYSHQSDLELKGLSQKNKRLSQIDRYAFFDPEEPYMARHSATRLPAQKSGHSYGK